MNNNKLSAMLQANKVWTILSMMGYQVNMTISSDDCIILKEIKVVAYYEQGNKSSKEIIEETIRKNMIDGDSFESNSRNGVAWITYTTEWK